MTATPILTIPDGAKQALAGKLPKRAKKVPNPRAQMALNNAVNNVVRKQFFGSRMEPTLKQRALMYTSFRALMTGYPGT